MRQRRTLSFHDTFRVHFMAASVIRPIGQLLCVVFCSISYEKASSWQAYCLLPKATPSGGVLTGGFRVARVKTASLCIVVCGFRRFRGLLQCAYVFGSAKSGATPRVLFALLLLLLPLVVVL